MRRLLALLLVLTATPVLAQGTPASAPAGHESKLAYDMAKMWLVRAAEQMPEADYAYRPTSEVRSFGQLIGHVANANYMMCANALGESSPSRENIEQARTTKAALVEALKASFDYCDRAYAQTPAQASMAAANFFTGAKTTRGGWLTFNAAHDFEHYGNIVTYMRMKGMVPPSSQGQGGGN